MRILLAAGIAVLSTSAAAQTQTPAETDEIWTCAAAAYYGGGVVVRFLREGSELVDERFHVRYRILEDTPDALVAVWSDARANPGGPGVSSAVILIDKRTGDFTRSNAAVPNQRYDRPISGNCIGE